MFWDLIVIGRGSAAAYYLSTVDRSMFPNILVIGTPDPWREERGYNATASGDPVNFINHTWQMIAHLSNIFPDFDISVVDRKAFASANEKVIDSCATTVLPAKVDKIDELDDFATSFSDSPKGYLKVFKVTTDSKVMPEATGKKIVVATGAGPHRVPDEVKNLNAPDRIMDMDAFGKKAGTFKNPEKLTVFVLGPNAAIDSVETAKFQKFNVVWLVKANAAPAILATPHQVYARDALKNDKVTYPEHPRGTAGFLVELTGATPPIRVTVKGKNALLGDLFVYGMGQEPSDAMKGIVPVAFRNRLQPIYDINQRFGSAHETVVGLKLENSDWKSGFEVIGALATQVTRGTKVPHTYKKELGDRINEVRAKVLPFLTGALVKLQTEILLKKLSELEKMSPGDARMQLKTAREWVESRYPSWKNHINALTSLLLNYITVARYFQGKENVGDADLSAAARILTPSVAQGPQLGVIRSQTAAQNGAVPGYIGTQVTAHQPTSSGPPKYLGVAAQSVGNQVNFSHDDATVLRVYIALNYPFVLEEDARGFIARVMSRRGDTAQLKGYGYGPTESKGFENELNSLNAKGLSALTSAKVSGTGKTLV